MSGPQKPIDPLAIVEMVQKGYTQEQIALSLGISRPTLSKRIAELKADQGLLIQYKSVRHLHLTHLQAKILEAITPEKIEAAPLKDLCSAYKILADKEGDLTENSEGKVKGLLAYLLELEKEAVETSIKVQQEELRTIDITPRQDADEDGEEDVEEGLPKLC